MFLWTTFHNYLWNFTGLCALLKENCPLMPFHFKILLFAISRVRRSALSQKKSEDIKLNAIISMGLENHLGCSAFLHIWTFCGGKAQRWCQDLTPTLLGLELSQTPFFFFKGLDPIVLGTSTDCWNKIYPIVLLQFEVKVMYTMITVTQTP